MPKTSSRMLVWIALSILLFIASFWAQSQAPASLAAVTLYKAHLMALGGWGGYWLDCALFPYARPHTFSGDVVPTQVAVDEVALVGGISSGSEFGLVMLRRAIVVAACLLCVGLGA